MKSSDSAGGVSSKLERKTIEKNRRMHMKSLCMKLSSLIPKQYQQVSTATNSKDASTSSQQDSLEQATTYIIELQQRIENLKQRKELSTNQGINVDNESNINKGNFKANINNHVELPMVEIRHQDLSMEIVLISGLNKTFKFHEVISVLEEEGAQVINASFSLVGDKIFHTIHSQVISSRIGLEVSRISDRLRDLVH